MRDMNRKDRSTRGDRNGNAKLTEEDIRDIRRRAGKGKSQRALAREYGVSEGTIWGIIHRKTWKHVA